jgi:uncharacterized coiled-coil DUF342 family protein
MLENIIMVTIEEMAAEREAQARKKVRDILNGITNQQAIIRACNEQIAQLRKALNEVTIEPVNAAEILSG